MNIFDASEQAESLQQPDNDTDHHDGVEDAFDRPVHGNVGIDEPQQHADDDKNDDQIHEWHEAHPRECGKENGGTARKFPQVPDRRAASPAGTPSGRCRIHVFVLAIADGQSALSDARCDDEFKSVVRRIDGDHRNRAVVVLA